MEQKKPRKPRIKKALDVKIDTKHVDVDIHRDASGVVDVIIDTPLLDAHYHKDAEGKKTFKIIDAHEYDFESNGTSPHLPKGSIWKITGEMLKNFLAKGLGKMIKK
jgi:hypothetical protein